jgi:molybdopterin/thiamine biosynthesis adenylyltransferase
MVITGLVSGLVTGGSNLQKNIAFNNTVIAKVKVRIWKREQQQLNRNWKTVTTLGFYVNQYHGVFTR